MRKRIYFLLSIMALAVFSCEETMNTGQLQGKTGLVVYSFPAAGDTFAIKVSVARSVNGQLHEPKGLEIHSLVNGVEDKIVKADSSRVDGMPVWTYWSVGSHKPGDEIKITAEADGMPAVYGKTSIPEGTDFDLSGMDTVYHAGDFYTLVKIRFSRLTDCNYYAVRLSGKNVFEENDSVSYEYEELEPDFEPLFNGGTKADIGFGTANSYYHHMYAVDLSNSTDSVIELRLATLYRSWTKTYSVELFTLEPEFYFMLKSLNDLDNNGMGEYGLSFVHPSYTNVRGGWGCVAGYHLAVR